VDKVQQARLILKDLGLPTSQQNEISALTLLALCGVGPKDPWRSAKREAQRVTKGVMSFMQERYGKTYAPNTRETVRRQVLHQFMQARIVDYNPFEPDLPTNSPRAHYAIAKDALLAIRKFDTPGWAAAAKRFVKKYNSLSDLYERRGERPLVPVRLPGGRTLDLSPGQHNEVQRAVIEHFAPRFAPGARLLYLGDTAKKNLFLDAAGLSALGFPLTDHDKLPDVVLYDERRRWLFLVEVVTSHGPMSPKRVFELEKMLEGSPAGCVYVSAFPDMAEFRRHTREIAWETEVWIAELPDHMIHYNGDKFFGPRKR
jgi:type II restriction enzyme